MVEPWQVYEQDGWHVVVHDVRHGEVYYQKWPPGVDEQGWLDNLGRMPLELFKAQVSAGTQG